MHFYNNLVFSRRFLELVFISIVLIFCSRAALASPDSLRDQALQPPPVNCSPGSKYADENRHWQGIPGIERSKNGRLWVLWYSGGEIIPRFKCAEGPDNYVVLVTSNNNGQSWSTPKLVIDPPGPVRAFDPVLWHDPLGRLWLFWSQSYDWFDGRVGLWCIVTENSDSENPTWSQPRRLCNGIMMNKPIVLHNGDWLLPVALWRPEVTFKRIGYMHDGSDLEVRSNVYCSQDQGKTWSLRGGAKFPQSNCDENMVVLRRDGSLWMLVRTNYGIGQTFSKDAGLTWSPGQPSKIKHTVARFFFRRLNSGNLILVKHGKIDQKTKGRCDLMAFVSDDDGKTWQGGLMLDDRMGVSYPDGVQAPDGRIYLTYDYNRHTDKEILMAVITEEDILAGKLVNNNSKLRILVNKATAPLDLSLNDSPSRLVSGRPIQVQNGRGHGLFALPGIASTPLAAVKLADSPKNPALLLASDRWFPGLFLYRGLGFTSSGSPIFSKPESIQADFLDTLFEVGTVFQNPAGEIYGIWRVSGKLVLARLNQKLLKFEKIAASPLPKIPRFPMSLSVSLRTDNLLDVFYGTMDATRYKPLGGSRSSNYVPYGPDGIWRGGLPHSQVFHFTLSFPQMHLASEPRCVCPIPQAGLLGIGGLALWQDKVGSILIFGDKLGVFHAVAHATSDTISPRTIRITGPQGNMLRHPVIMANPCTYNGADGSHGIIAVGEGEINYYRHISTDLDKNKITFSLAQPVFQKPADLYDGSLIVPSVADWNGDGNLDIIAGNSQGYLVFFENLGDNQRPSFASAQRLSAGGELIQIQAGYRGSIQGPGEARWGYTSTTVVDWNRDGLPDILCTDIRGIHNVYLNIGTTQKPKLALPKPLYLEGLEMHGTWRTKPAVYSDGNTRYYITLDDQDSFHRYRQLDDFNLADVGPLHLTDGRRIYSNYLKAGGTGRMKFECVDWDRDGALDLLVGTPRCGSVPDPNSGIPWAYEDHAAAVLMLRNIGTNTDPIYEFPRSLHFHGKRVLLGQHACSPSVAFFDPQRPDLIVGTEQGRLLYYAHDDVTWK